jgi:hypothetical protein
MPKQKVLSAALAAALASGATVTPELQAQADTDNEDHGTTDTPAETETQAAAATTENQDEPTQAAAAAAATTAAVDPPQNDNSVALVAHLKSELSDLRAAQTTLTVENATIKRENETLKATSAGLTTIVRTAAKRLCVALNASAVQCEALEGAALCDLFNKMNTEFEKQYKTGATSKVETERPEGEAIPANSHLQQAAVSAARPKR